MRTLFMKRLISTRLQPGFYPCYNSRQSEDFAWFVLWCAEFNLTGRPQWRWFLTCREHGAQIFLHFCKFRELFFADSLNFGDQGFDLRCGRMGINCRFAAV